MTITDMPRTYSYVPFTLDQRIDRLSPEQELELAEEIIADEVFLGKLNWFARTNLQSDDPRLVHEALVSIRKFEDKIRHEGGWHKFFEIEMNPIVDEDDPGSTRVIVRTGPTETQQELATRDLRIRQEAGETIKRLMGLLAANEGLTPADSEMVNMWLGKLSGYRTMKQAVLIQLLEELEALESVQLIMSTNPHFFEEWEQTIRIQAAKQELEDLQTEVRNLTRRLMAKMINDGTDNAVWSDTLFNCGYGCGLTDPDQIREWIGVTNTILNPPAPEPSSEVVQKTKPNREVNWDKQDGIIVPPGTKPNPMGVDADQRHRGRTVADPERTKKRVKGGGVKSHPGRRGGSPNASKK